MSAERECEVCKRRGQWGTVAIGNDIWWLCYEHQHAYRVMALAWFAQQRAS